MATHRSRDAGWEALPCVTLTSSGSTLNLGSTKETPELASLEWSGLDSFWKDMGLLGI